MILYYVLANLVVANLLYYITGVDEHTDIPCSTTVHLFEYSNNTVLYMDWNM